MDDFLLGEINRNPMARLTSGDNMSVGLGTSAKAAFDDPRLSILRLLQTEADMPDKVGDNMISPEDLREKYKGSGLKFTEPLSSDYAQKLVRNATDEKIREDLVQKGPKGFLAEAARMGASFGGAATDPFNVLSGFLPIVSSAKAGGMIARYGSLKGRAAVGAIEGVVGNAMLEPAVAGLSKRQQLDYTMADSLVNIAFGGVIGGGLHVGGGLIGKWVGSLPERDRELIGRYVISERLKGRTPAVEDMMNIMGYRINGEDRPIEYRQIQSDSDAINLRRVNNLDDLEVAVRGYTNNILPNEEIVRLEKLVNTKHKDSLEAEQELTTHRRKTEVKQIVDEAKELIEAGADEGEVMSRVRQKLRRLMRDSEMPDETDPVIVSKKFTEEARTEGTDAHKMVSALVASNTAKSLREMADQEGIGYRSKDNKKVLAEKIIADRLMKEKDAGVEIGPRRSVAESYENILSPEAKETLERERLSAEVDEELIGFDPYEDAGYSKFNAAVEEHVAEIRGRAVKNESSLSPEETAVLREVDRIDQEAADSSTAISSAIQCMIGS